jgi:hypothetical protein
MPDNTSLPGFERLVATCRQHALKLELSPPLSSAPQAGARLLDQPIDPLLATLYKTVGGATLGPLALVRPNMEWDGLLPWNTALRKDGTEPFRSTLVFGKETGFSNYFGTVPSLANAEGLQPIVYASAYPGAHAAVPVASNLERFFELYSRFLELMVVDAEYVKTGMAELLFPWSVPQLVAQDAPLMELLQDGRFSHLFQHEEGARDWVDEVLAASPSTE